MYEIDPQRLDLVEEFKAQPFGPHGPELRRLLQHMRMGPIAGRYVLVCTERHREWVLAQLPERRGEEVRLHEQHRYHNLAQAEWEVFALRWKAHTGQDPRERVDPPDYDRVAAPGRR